MARGEWLKKIFERLPVNGTAGCSRLTGCGKVSTIRNTKEFAFYIRRSNAKISKSANLYSDCEISWRMFRFAIVWDALTCFDVSQKHLKLLCTICELDCEQSKSRSLTLAIFASFSTDFKTKESRLLAVYVNVNTAKTICN